MEFGEFGFGGLEDGDAGVGIFPEREEILIGGAGFGSVALLRIGASEAEMGESADEVVHDDAEMVEDFLEFGGGFVALMRGEIGFATHIDRVQGRPTVSAGR